MHIVIKTSFVFMGAALLGGCVSVPPPTGPTVNVMPAPGKPFELFQQESAYCQQYAQGEIGPVPDAAGRTAGGAAAGAVVGAVAGTLLGGRNGTGTGAAVGMLIGGSNGSESTDRSRMSQQQRYNAAFEQCMYSKGDQVPGYYAPSAYSPPPPPPPGAPPPPPDRH